MPMIDCPDCGGTGYDLNLNLCETCDGEGDVPDDFFPEDSSELRDPDEEPEPVNPEPRSPPNPEE